MYRIKKKTAADMQHSPSSLEPKDEAPEPQMEPEGLTPDLMFSGRFTKLWSQNGPVQSGVEHELLRIV